MSNFAIKSASALRSTLRRVKADAAASAEVGPFALSRKGTAFAVRGHVVGTVATEAGDIIVTLTQAHDTYNRQGLQFVPTDARPDTDLYSAVMHIGVSGLVSDARVRVTFAHTKRDTKGTAQAAAAFGLAAAGDEIRAFMKFEGEHADAFEAHHDAILELVKDYLTA